MLTKVRNVYGLIVGVWKHQVEGEAGKADVQGISQLYDCHFIGFNSLSK